MARNRDGIKRPMKVERSGLSSFVLRQPTQRGQVAVQDFGRFRRAAGHENIHWNNIRDAADDSVAAFKDTTIFCAVPHRDNQLWGGSRLVGLEQRYFHVPRSPSGA